MTTERCTACDREIVPQSALYEEEVASDTDFGTVTVSEWALGCPQCGARLLDDEQPPAKAQPDYQPSPDD